MFDIFLLGLSEELLLVAPFRAHVLRTVPLLSGANYFSAWMAGHWGLMPLADRLASDSYEAWRYTW